MYSAQLSVVLDIEVVMENKQTIKHGSNKTVFNRPLLLMWVRFVIRNEKRLFGSQVSFLGKGRQRMQDLLLHFNNHPYERNGCK